MKTHTLGAVWDAGNPYDVVGREEAKVSDIFELPVVRAAKSAPSNAFMAKATETFVTSV